VLPRPLNLEEHQDALIIDLAVLVRLDAVVLPCVKEVAPVIFDCGCADQGAG
jgi:hypothetical protein